VAPTLPALSPDAPTAAPGGPLIRARYDEVRALTERLAAPLSAEDQTVQSMPDASPTKWHRAHTTWFFETFLLVPRQRGYQPFDPQFGYLFNSYYEAVGARHPRPQRGLVSRPGIAEVASYRSQVDVAMRELVDEVASGGPPDVADLVELGLQHEQQHQELLLMDVKHVLSCNPLFPAYLDSAAPMAATNHPCGWVSHDGGLVEIGHAGPGFAFDNESPRHAVWLEPFALADRPVTTGEWLSFMADGGYRRPELWLSDGWAAVQAGGWDAPLYWFPAGDAWDVFTLGGLRPVDPAAPVCHVSYYEADAFARWSGARLPTEAEWEAVAGVPAAVPAAGLDLAVLHPKPVAPGAIAASVGEVWEWTGSAYLPYPRFRPAAGAIGEYNGKFMVNQQVLRGSCCVTPPGHTRPTYRNFFPPSARWPFAGLRVARDL
jgi:ergothioneine biosynthesis protein EgtB